jgi:hypothetical protein
MFSMTLIYFFSLTFVVTKLDFKLLYFDLMIQQIFELFVVTLDQMINLHLK